LLCDPDCIGKQLRQSMCQVCDQGPFRKRVVLSVFGVLPIRESGNPTGI
jgi:hypothetical protein